MNTQELLDVVNKVIPSINTKGLVEGMDSLLFHNGSMSAYNDKVSIDCLLPEESDINGSVIASDFYKIIKSIKDTDVVLSIANNKMVISSKSTEAELSLSNSEIIRDKINSLALDEIEFVELPNMFIEGLNLCSNSASDGVNNDQNLFCISCCDKWIVSTDRYRISSYYMKEKFEYPFLLPKTVSSDVVTFRPTDYCVKNGWVHFTNIDNAVLSCRIVEDKTENSFLEYLKIFNRCGEGTSIELPNKLKEVLDSVIGFSEEALAVKKTVQLHINNNILNCKIQKETGWVKKKIDIESDIDISFMISGVFLRDVLNCTTELFISEDKTLAMLKHKNFRHMIVLPE